MSFSEKFSMFKQWTREKLGSAERTPESEAHIAAEAQIKTARAHLEKLRSCSKEWKEMHEKTIAAFENLATKVSETFFRDAAATTVTAQFYRYGIETSSYQRGVGLGFEAAFIARIDDLLLNHIPVAEELLEKANDARLLYDAQRNEVKSLENDPTEKDALPAARARLESLRQAYELAEQQFLDAASALNTTQSTFFSTELPLFIQSLTGYHQSAIEAGDRFATNLRERPNGSAISALAMGAPADSLTSSSATTTSQPPAEPEIVYSPPRSPDEIDD